MGKWRKVRLVVWTAVLMTALPHGPDLASSLGTHAATLAAQSSSTDGVACQVHP